MHGRQELSSTLKEGFVKWEKEREGYKCVGGE